MTKLRLQSANFSKVITGALTFGALCRQHARPLWTASEGLASGHSLTRILITKGSRSLLLVQLFYLRRMNDILIPSTIGDKQTNVRISFPYGGAGIGHIYIDKYFQGQVTSTGVWLNSHSILTPEDVGVIKEAIKPHGIR